MSLLRGRAVLLVLAAAVVAAGEGQLLLQLRHLVARLLQLLVQLAPAKYVQIFQKTTEKRELTLSQSMPEKTRAKALGQKSMSPRIKRLP